MFRGLRLHHRIVIPFAIVAIVATLASAFAALAVVSRAFETRIQSQILNTAEVISRGGFAANPAIIRSVKAITGAEIITFDPAGSVVSTTVDPSRGDLLRAVITSPHAGEARANPGRRVVHEMQCDAPCYVSYHVIPDRPGVLTAVVVEAAETTAAVAAVSRTILVAALASLVVLLVISQLVARRVTRPIDDLARFTNDVAGGARGRAAEGGDEVGRLGRSFNTMLDRLDESKAALVRSEKLGLAGLIAARVAHDIRNPLASMKINAQLLQGAVRRDEQNAQLVAAVLHDIGQIEAVIRDLIELARPGELRLASADLNAVVRGVLTPLEGRMRHLKIQLRLRLAEPLPAVALDTERFTQALLNVIVNAIEAMPNGGTLSIATAHDEAGVSVDIEDDGSGIEASIADRVFDPFVSTKPEGVGLGLVNARAVVDGHRGRITLSPRQPRGTRARIVLPVA
jgi:signal transduction histidine kinase